MGKYDGSPISDAELQAWIDFYGLTFPVLNDSNWTIFSRYGWLNTVPFNILLDRCMKIDYKQHGFNESYFKSRVEALLEQEIPE